MPEDGKGLQKMVEEFDNLLLDTQKILISILIRLGPFFVALMPAMFTGYSIFGIFKEQPITAWTFALIVGFALEAVGILATHTSVELYNAWQANYTERNKFVLMILMVPIYILAVDAIVLYAHAYEPVIAGIAIASPWLTCITYLAIALTADIHDARKQSALAESRAEQKEAEQSQQDFAKSEAQAERELRKEQMRLEHELKLMQLNLQTAKAEQKQEKPPGEFVCENVKCPEVFDTVQARNAHSRWCKFKPVAHVNGTEKAKVSI